MAATVPPPPDASADLSELIYQWATGVTDATMAEHEQSLNAKIRTIQDFFDYLQKQPHEVKSRDVVKWHQYLAKKRGLAAGTIYALVSRVSSFFAWRMRDPEFAAVCTVNPAKLGRPKAPVPYAQADPLTDAELTRLMDVIQARSEEDDIVGYRDYALLLFYILTGMSRSDILRLKWRDLQITDTSLIFTVRVHSGHKRTREIVDPTLREALLSYLQKSQRLETIQPDEPVWIRHDPASMALDDSLVAQPRPITVQAVDKSIKQYAKKANIKDFHLHRLRHTYARLIGEALHNVEDVQEALGHQTSRTTIQLLNQIKIERDRISPHLARRLGLDEQR